MLLKGKVRGLMVLLSKKNSRPEMSGMKTVMGTECARVLAVMLGLRHH